jgi:cell wall-associated NlpC family hydrolase
MLGGSGAGAGRLPSVKESVPHASATAPSSARPASSTVRAPAVVLLAALTVPLVAGVGGVGERTAGAATGSLAAVAVRFALAQLGKPYQWGVDGPRSFDCSGLVQTSYRAAGINLPRVSRP